MWHISIAHNALPYSAHIWHLLYMHVRVLHLCFACVVTYRCTFRPNVGPKTRHQCSMLSLWFTNNRLFSWNKYIRGLIIDVTVCRLGGFLLANFRYSWALRIMLGKYRTGTFSLTLTQQKNGYKRKELSVIFFSTAWIFFIHVLQRSVVIFMCNTKRDSSEIRKNRGITII